MTKPQALAEPAALAQSSGWARWGSAPRIPASSLDDLGRLGFSNDEVYRIVAPRRTLARRKANAEDLTITESDRVRRLERISELAARVFGNAEKAQRWLRKPNRAMDDAIPVQLLETETGAHLVEQELVRIDYGIFA